MAEEFDAGGTAAAGDGSYTMPEDGDPLTAASARAMVEELSQSVERLTQLVNPGEGYPGSADFNRQIGFGSILYLDPTNGTIDTFGTTGQGVGNVSNTPAGIGDAFTIICDVTESLPHGASLNAVAVLVAGGTTSAGVPNDMPRIRFYSQLMTAAAAAPPYTEHESQTDSVATQGTWQAKHWFQCTIDPVLVIDREATSGRRYYLELRGEYGALVTQSARYLGFMLSFAADTIDPAAG